MVQKQKSIPWPILVRDRDLYRQLLRKMTFGEKLALFDEFGDRGDYLRYQRALKHLARKKGLRIPRPS